ncbi:MAG: TIGR03936 family radical SAM-associated protein [Pirellulales bacterium]
MSDSATTRLRIRFTKCGDLRWISHRDLARVWERLLRRAELDLAFSQGFHPKPKISFPSALTLGIEALDEVVELELVGALDLADIRQRIAAQMPSGMELLSMEKQVGKTRLLGASYQMDIPQSLVESTGRRIEEVLQAGTIQVLREGKHVECSCQDAYFEIKLEGNKLLFSIPAAESGASLRPSELLTHLHLEELLTDGTLLQRTQVHLEQQTPQHSSATPISADF